MEKEIKDKFPDWCGDAETKFELLLSDDIDSLMCYVYQNEKFDRKCKWFYETGAYTNYQHIYKQEDYIKEESVLGLDIALQGKIRCWDNHVTKYLRDDTVNPNSANMNKDISSSNYYSKYCISSFITMLSYYDEDLTKWTKEQLGVLCAIDGLYQPFLPRNTKFQRTATNNLKRLDYSFLADFMQENIKYIEELKSNLKLDEKIKVNEDGYLTTKMDLVGLSNIFGCDIELPDIKFKLRSTLQRYSMTISNSKDAIDKKMVNFALTNKNYCNYSVIN